MRDAYVIHERRCENNPLRLEFVLSAACYRELQNLIEYRLKQHSLLNARGAQLRTEAIYEFDPIDKMTKAVRTYVIVVPGYMASSSPLAPGNVCAWSGRHIFFAVILGMLAILLHWIYQLPS
jgi:hypothetical protein